ALLSNTIGIDNTANGAFALLSNTGGAGNTAVGFEALKINTAGEGNTAIGRGALMNTTGAANTAVGDFAGTGVQNASNVICIGYSVSGTSVSGSCFIGNIRGVQTQNADAIPVVIDSNFQLGTINSSRRYKTDVKPMCKASESILALKPVSFHYKVHK